MLWPALVALGLVATVGIASALKNWTALALVWNYIIVTGTWWVTRGAPLSPEETHQVAIMADYMVLVVIFVKVNNDCEPSPGPWGWLKDCWPHSTWWDKAVVVLFLPSWISYAVPMPSHWAYWIAWTAGVLQLFAAGGEALENWRRGRAQVDDDNPTDLSSSRQGLRYEC